MVVVGSELKSSSMGLSKLFVLRDERLQRVMVKGDMIITERQRNSEPRLPGKSQTDKQLS